MKSLTKVFLLAGLLFACVPQMSHALGLSISSTTNVAGQPIPAFLVRRNESVSYVLASTGAATNSSFNAGTTAQLEASTNMSNWVIQVATATPVPGNIGAGLSGTLAPVFQDTYYRWNILQSSGGAVIVTLADVDDTVQVVKNNKQIDTFSITDDSVRIMGASLFADIYTLQSSSAGSAISLSSSTQLQWRVAPSTNNYRSITAPGGVIQLDKSFTILGSTGAGQADDGTGKGGLLLSALPTISTNSAINGDMVIFQSAVSSVTFSDNATLVGSCLRLGATTRSLGVGDIMGLIYLNGFWREYFFVNNITQ